MDAPPQEVETNQHCHSDVPPHKAATSSLAFSEAPPQKAKTTYHCLPEVRLQNAVIYSRGSSATKGRDNLPLFAWSAATEGGYICTIYICLHVLLFGSSFCASVKLCHKRPRLVTSAFSKTGHTTPQHAQNELIYSIVPESLSAWRPATKTRSIHRISWFLT